MEDRTIYALIESIDRLTDNIEELSVKVKRLTNSNPITPEIYEKIKNYGKV